MSSPHSFAVACSATRVEAMNHYVDIVVRSDPEVAQHQLMDALFTRLHLALVARQRGDIGVSFPGHDERKPCLGGHMRLHGVAAELSRFLESSWLKGVREYVGLSEVVPAPPDAHHRQVMRVQTKSSAERLRRRAMRRHGLTQEEAAGRIPDAVERRLSLPFVTIGSRSTGQPAFRLFISHGPLLQHPAVGGYNSYGLSQGGSIPWF